MASRCRAGWAKLAETFIVSRWVRSIRIDEMSVCFRARIDAGDDVGLVLARPPAAPLPCPTRLRTGCRRSRPRLRVGGAVAVDRDEQVRLQLACEAATAPAATRKLIVVAGRAPRAPGPSASSSSRIARAILSVTSFSRAAIDRRDRARIEAAMAGIDHDQRAVDRASPIRDRAAAPACGSTGRIAHRSSL